MNIQTIKDFLNKLNQKGIPIPLIKDPKSGMGSVSLSLVVLSSIWVQVALFCKYFTIKCQNVDVSSATNWFLVAAGLYFGRNLSFGSTSLKQEIVKEDTKNE